MGTAEPNPNPNPNPEVKPYPLKKVARACAVALLIAADRKTSWSKEDSQSFTLAFNSLQRLSGHKIMLDKERRPHSPKSPTKRPHKVNTNKK